MPPLRILHTILHLVDSIGEFRRHGIEMFASARVDFLLGGVDLLGDFVADPILRPLLEDIARAEREQGEDESDLLQF